MATTSTQRLLGLKRLVLVPPVVAAALYVYFLKSYTSKRRTKRAPSEVSLAQPPKSGKSQRVGVNLRFLKQMQRLLPILIPGSSSFRFLRNKGSHLGVFSRESFLLVSLAGVLVARTLLDIWFSAFNGQVVKAIVSRDRATFVARAGVEFGLMMWPLSIVNNSLKFLINALTLSFRTRLTEVCPIIH